MEVNIEEDPGGPDVKNDVVDEPVDDPPPVDPEAVPA